MKRFVSLAPKARTNLVRAFFASALFVSHSSAFAALTALDNSLKWLDDLISPIVLNSILCLAIAVCAVLCFMRKLALGYGIAIFLACMALIARQQIAAAFLSIT